MLDLIGSSINDSKMTALVRALRDLNRAIENQKDPEYATEYKPNLNMEYLGHTLAGIATYLELNQSEIQKTVYVNKARVLSEGVRKLNEVLEKLE